MKLNISCPSTGGQKMIEVDDEKKLRALYDRRISQELDGDQLGEDFAGYVFRISGGNDKQGFPMKQGVLCNHRVRLLLRGAASRETVQTRADREILAFVTILRTGRNLMEPGARATAAERGAARPVRGVLPRLIGMSSTDWRARSRVRLPTGRIRKSFIRQRDSALVMTRRFLKIGARARRATGSAERASASASLCAAASWAPTSPW